MHDIHIEIVIDPRDGFGDATASGAEAVHWAYLGPEERQYSHSMFFLAETWLCISPGARVSKISTAHNGKYENWAYSAREVTT